MQQTDRGAQGENYSKLFSSIYSMNPSFLAAIHAISVSICLIFTGVPATRRPRCPLWTELEQRRVRRPGHR